MAVKTKVEVRPSISPKRTLVPLYIFLIAVIMIVFYTLRIIGKIQNREERVSSWIDMFMVTADKEENDVNFFTEVPRIISDDLFVLTSSVTPIVSVEDPFVLLCVLSFVVTALSTLYIYRLGKNSEWKQTDKRQTQKEASRNPGIHKQTTCFSLVISFLVLMAFLASIPWEFMRLYQTEVAKKISVMQGGIPKECLPEEMSFIKSMKYLLSWYFSWYHNPCENYHKALVVDPLWEIPPLLVLTSLLSRAILHPVELLCSGAGKSVNFFFREIPGPWQPVMFVSMTTIFIFSLLVVFRYRISFPFLMKIEPKTPVHMQIKNSKHKKIRSKKSSNSDEKRQLEYTNGSS